MGRGSRASVGTSTGRGTGVALPSVRARVYGGEGGHESREDLQGAVLSQGVYAKTVGCSGGLRQERGLSSPVAHGGWVGGDQLRQTTDFQWATAQHLQVSLLAL